VLFTLMVERYERASFITSNLVFSEWDRIFKNPMTTAAAIDRPVCHSVILGLMSQASVLMTRSPEERGQRREEPRPGIVVAERQK
jgi:DNA replication protein DnaC